MPRTRPMPAAQRAICNRLRQFRLKTELSKAQFSILAGLNPRAYEGYDHARSQLNYPAAQQILNFFWTLNPIWLVDGTGEMVGARRFEFPTAQELGVGPRALFSDVFRNRLLDDFLKVHPSRTTGPVLPVKLFVWDDTPLGRMNNVEQFAELTREWMAELPEGKVARFMDELFLNAASLFARYPRDQDKASVDARKSEMLEIEQARRFPPEPKKGNKMDLTDTASAGIPVAVKPQMPKLLVDLKKATEAPGTMSALAEYLSKATGQQVPLASVSRWIAGRREPGGEITLLMQHWVKQRECKK